MYSDTGNTTSLVLGFPIRTSSDQRSVDSSPRHIAASHVLHRPLMPRHPPCALKHLQNTKTKKQFREITPQQANTKTPPPPKMRTGTHASLMLATTIHESNTTPHHQAGQQQSTPPPTRELGHLRFPNQRGEEATGLLSQDPTVCLATSVDRCFPTSQRSLHDLHQNPHPLQVSVHPTNRLAHRTPARCGRDQVSWCSLERR